MTWCIAAPAGIGVFGSIQVLSFTAKTTVFRLGIVPGRVGGQGSWTPISCAGCRGHPDAAGHHRRLAEARAPGRLDT